MQRPVLVLLAVALTLGAAGAQDLPLPELRERRERIRGRFPDGIVLLHARPTEAALDSHGFKQNPSFFYFTGLASQPSAILALDGPRRESLLFVPDAPESFGFPVAGVSLAPGDESARRTGLDRVAHFREFRPWLEGRLREGVETLFLDESRRVVMPGNPDDLWPMAGEATLWRRSLAEAFPGAELKSAEPMIRELRWVKSPSEIAVLRDVARASAAALLEGIRAVRPGARQRETEAAVVCGCIEAGAEGPSFWPWTMSGPNARARNLVRSLYDYDHLDRSMEEGELVRMDVGCDLGFYEGDVGRTVPVSGRFRTEQAEAWDLLVAAYRAGLAAMRAGVARQDVAEASRAAVRRAEPSLHSEYARRAAQAMLGGGDDLWHVHGVGLEGGEERRDPLEAGSVVAFEPMFEVGDDAYYLEDMILVTETGHEILSLGLPYSAEEIARVMAPR